MIEVSELTYTYPGGKQFNFGSFKIDQGRHTLVLGESGNGKTTLLHLLGGLLRGYGGTIHVANTNLATLQEGGLDRFRGRHIGFVFQRLHLLRSLNVHQNLTVTSWLSGTPSSKDRALQVLSQLNLADKIHSPVSELSQGQAQRVAIARAVLNKPAVILADEPTSALDDRNCNDVMNLLLSAADESGATLFIATHDQRMKSGIPNTIRIGK
jgi:ABC-type lipoprotein export system ATPase subunit